MEDQEVVSVSTSVLLMGQGHFIREVAAPLSEALEEIALEHPTSQEEQEWRPRFLTGYQASLTELSGLAGVVLFIGSWAATKALDELYDRTLKPTINKVLGDFFGHRDSDKKYGATLVINNLQEKVSILVVIVGRDIQEIETGERQVSSVIACALETARLVAKPETVHLYLIESGQVNDHPWVYDNLEQAMRHMGKMSAARPVKTVRAGS